MCSTACAARAHCVCTACALQHVHVHVHCLCTAYPLPMHCLCTAMRGLRVRLGRTACALMCAACTPQVQLRRRASSTGLTGDALISHEASRKTVAGVKFVKVGVASP